MIVMTKRIFILLILTLYFYEGQVFAQNNLTYAIEFIDQLKQKSPKYHGKPLNKYFITDLNNDNIYEIVERTNRIEAKTPGFLPSNLSVAFDYENIYCWENKKYELNNYKFKSYLHFKKSIYEFWKKKFMQLGEENNNDNINELIQANQEYFLNEINNLIYITENQISKE